MDISGTIYLWYKMKIGGKGALVKPRRPYYFSDGGILWRRLTEYYLEFQRWIRHWIE